MPIKFRFSWLPFIATLVVMAIGIALGNWQMRRAEHKTAIQNTMQSRQLAPEIVLGDTAIAPEAAEFRRIRVKGRFVANWPIYLDNRPYQGRAGFYMLMPMIISGTDKAVLVARGWIARDVADRTRVPATMTPAGEVEITGIARRHAGRLFQMGAPITPQPGAILQNMRIDELAAASKLDLQPFLVEQGSELADGLVRDWPMPSYGIDKHHGYAFQWYALAATAFLFFVVTGFRRGAK